MSRLILPVAFLLSLLVVGAALFLFEDQPSSQVDPADIVPFAVDDAIPPSTIVDRDGKSVALAQLLGKKTLVTFWSVTCNECASALTLLRDQVDASRTSVVLINIRDTQADGEKKLAELGVKIPSYYDQDADTFRAWSATVPATYYLENNRIRYFFPGRMSPQQLDRLLTL